MNHILVGSFQILLLISQGSRCYVQHSLNSVNTLEWILFIAFLSLLIRLNEKSLGHSSFISYFIDFQMLLFPFSLFFYCKSGNEMGYIGWHKKLFIAHIWNESWGGKRSYIYMWKCLKEKQDGHQNFSGSTQTCCFASLWHGIRAARLCPGTVCAIGAKVGKAGTLWAWLQPLLPQRLASFPFFPPLSPCCSIAQGAH